MNRAQASKIFETLEETQYYKENYCGLITFISKNEEQEITRDNYIDEHGDNIILPLKTETKEQNIYYILNIREQVDLTNGFRFIKELLSNHHNYRIFSDHRKFKKSLN